MSDIITLKADISAEVANTLKDLAERRGVSMTRMLQQAIVHEKFFQDVLDKKQKVLIEEGPGRFSEVLL